MVPPSEPGRLSRRGFLAGSLGAAALIGAGRAPALLRRAPTVRPAPDPRVAAALRVLGRTHLRAPDSLPVPSLPAGSDTMPQIEHFVVLMMENHSYDNLLGMLPRGDGFRLGPRGQPTATNPYPDGRLQHAFRMPTTCQLPGRPSQEWAASHNAYDGGRMDGFVRTVIDPYTAQIVGGVAMGYWTGEDLPFLYGLADAFCVGDRWFSSVLGQTDPNRRYLIAATSAGMTDDIGTGPGNAVPDAGLPLPANGTIFDRFETYGISWLNYTAGYPTGATPELYPSDDAPFEQPNHRPFDQFFADARAGRLPSFTLLDPDYTTQSQENPQNLVVGEAMLADVVQAIGESPLWRRTLLTLLYDEHGGYYDHVPPPVALAPDDIPPMVQPKEATYDGFHRYGFRVPSVVVSAYSRPRQVTHVVHDHTSVLAMVERKWNLPALTYRDANANDLADFLDPVALRRHRPTFPALPSLPAPNDTSAALACSATGPGTIPPPGSISAAPRR